MPLFYIDIYGLLYLWLAGFRGYANHSQAIDDNCRDAGISVRYIPALSNNYKLINEGNLYRLILKSTKPEAEKFESFVCDEVLPSIRKTGSYSIAPSLPDFTDPVAAARAWADEREEKKALEKQNEHQKDSIVASNEASIKFGEICITEFVKTNDAIDIGGPTFIVWMRKMDILFKNPRQPKQYYVGKKYLTWKFSKEPINGKKRRELKVTPRGQLYLATKYMKSKIAKLDQISEALHHNGVA